MSADDAPTTTVTSGQGDGEGDDLAFEYADLWYIPLRSSTDKLPARKWGGYDQDFAEADHVYDHATVVEHPEVNWGVVGIQDRDHLTRSLLIFDLDLHKAPDDFDPSDVTVPKDTLVVRSQNGGLHVYFACHICRGGCAESDFVMTRDLGWDIDIRGSLVKHHVVAPADIPGVGGRYEVVNGDSITHVIDPADAASRIRYRGDDTPVPEPLLEFDPDAGTTRGRGRTADIDLDLGDPPEDRPRCYHHGLELRHAAPEAPWYNPHRVNTLTALCGLAAGYDAETVVEDMIEDYPPEGGPATAGDRERTDYHVTHLAGKVARGDLAPPAISTLREAGLLDSDESCDCPIPYHGGDGEDGGGDGDEESPSVPRCPECYRALGEHTALDDRPSVRRCPGCHIEWAASEVMSGD